VLTVGVLTVSPAHGEMIKVDNPGNVKMNKQVWLFWKPYTDANRRPVPARNLLIDVSGMLKDKSGAPLPNAGEIERNIEFALKEWLTFGEAPVAGDTNPNQTGKASMASGNEHGDTVGKTFRAMSQDEKNALTTRYGMDAVGVRKANADETPDITFSWDFGLPRLPQGMGPDDVGFMDPTYGSTKVNGSIWGAHSNLATKTHALIVLRGPDSDYFKQGGRKGKLDASNPWSFVDVTGKDIVRDYVRNGDLRQPASVAEGKGQFDFYSVIKHEIGHAVSFKHDGGNRLKSLDPDEHSWVNPQRLLLPGLPTPALGLAPTRGDFEARASRLFISAELPGGFGGTDLYVVEHDSEGGAWLLPRNLGPTINTPFDEVDPHLADDNHTLLFASNRPGGAGAHDLYEGFFDLDADAWTTQALDALNSPFDDIAPDYRTGQDQVFFASNRPFGCGGLDLYSSVWALEEPGDGFMAPANLGCSVNSAFDDRDPAVSTYTQALYFSSDRPGGPGGFDLYQALFDLSGVLANPRLIDGVNSPGHEHDPSFGLDDQFLYFAACDADGCHAHEVESASVPEPALVLMLGLGLLAARRAAA
jgi:hypothetical protein